MKLTVVEEGVQTQLDIARPVITIGRALDNDIRLSNTLVSRHHSRIDTHGGEAWVIDLGSANGTSVNGEKIARRLLSAGDEIQVGGTRLILEAPEEAVDQTQRLPGVDEIEGDAGLRTLSGEARRERENLRVFARITRDLVRETDLLPLLRSIVD